MYAADPKNIQFIVIRRMANLNFVQNYFNKYLKMNWKPSVPQ